MTYNDVNDYELIYLIKEENEEAYTTIFSKYKRIVSKEARKLYKMFKYLGVDYEDLYQAGIIGLSNAVSTFNSNEGVLFYTYVSAVIKREIQSLVRKSSRNKHNVLSDSTSLNKNIDDDDTVLGDIISEEKGDTADILSEYHREREILNLKYNLDFLQASIYELRLNNFSNREISELLNISYKKVDNNLLAIKNKLRKFKNKIEVY